jgi:hypothetical protein
VQIARHPPEIKQIPGGHRQSPAHGTSAAPLTTAHGNRYRGHCVNLDISGRRTIFVKKGEFS